MPLPSNSISTSINHYNSSERRLGTALPDNPTLSDGDIKVNPSQVTFQAVGSPEHTLHAIIEVISSIQDTITAAKDVFEALISECERVNDRLEKCTKRFQYIDKSSSILLDIEYLHNPDTRLSRRESLGKMETASSQKRSASMIASTSQAISEYSISKHLQEKYMMIRNMNSSYYLLRGMDEYMPLMSSKAIKDISSCQQLYSNPSYFFNTWKQMQLKKLKEIKKARKHKKTVKENIDHVRDLRSQGPKNIAESVVYLAAKNAPKRVASEMILDQDGNIVKKESIKKDIISIDWKDRYMVDGVPVHASRKASHKALKSYYTSYIHIAPRLSFRNSSNSDDDDALESFDESDISASSSVLSSVNTTPRAARPNSIYLGKSIDLSPSATMSPRTQYRALSTKLKTIARTENLNDDVKVLDRWDEGLSPTEVSKDADMSISSSISDTDSSPAKALAFHPSDIANKSNHSPPPPPPPPKKLSPLDTVNQRNNSPQVAPSLPLSPSTPPPPPPPATAMNRPQRPATIRMRSSSRFSFNLDEQFPMATINEVSNEEDIKPIAKVQVKDFKPTPPPASVPPASDKAPNIERGDMNDRDSITLPSPKINPPTPRLGGVSATPTGKTLRKSMNMNGFPSNENSPMMSPQLSPNIHTTATAAATSITSPETPSRPQIPAAKMSLLDAIKSGESKLKKVNDIHASATKALAIGTMSKQDSATSLGFFNSDAVNALLARRKFISDTSSSSDDDETVAEKKVSRKKTAESDSDEDWI